MLSHDVQKLYMKHPSLLEGDVLDSRLIYSPETDTFYALNRSALLVWLLIDRQGGFGTGFDTGAKRIYEDWFSPSPKREQVEGDIEKIISEFVKHGLLIKRPKSIKLFYTSCPVHENRGASQYSPPKITIYDSQWMKDNHPQYYHSITYSDLWGPSET
jgi:hypothetical protein